MYDTKRLASGVGVLLTLWALVGLLILSTGVGVSIPLSSTGGFNVSADYLTASEATVVPAKTKIVTPSVLFEVERSYIRDLNLQKTLNVSDVPGLTGRLQIQIRSEEATAEGVAFKTDRITAQTATWRGFVLDERTGPKIFDRFKAYAGPNPNQAPNTNDPLQIEGSDPGAIRPSDGDPAFELRGAKITTSTLSADQLQLSDLSLRVRYDFNNDGEFEYGA
ncbi:hypothetical protein [Halorientalis pallida]|uniref:Uncharacterized protein n=1 Tax=Halorientalis pallida TaxID=2479928 RepID=A0A498KRI3_9EURY|nr:hypothetical protein [Halorientalis pallida]RXK46294.1 hypothetical protein EAF64_19650 [Halorientalis pallida]